MKNKKGFTLVELLAVIVILALIMSIAVISIGGVLDSTRKNTFKETAVSIINGVRQQLIINNKLDEGQYLFKSALLEKGADTDAPLGGKIDVGFDSCADTNKIGDYVCKASIADSACAPGQKSYVKVTKSADEKFAYQICLTAGANHYYINLGSETDLLNNNKTEMIVKPTVSET